MKLHPQEQAAQMICDNLELLTLNNILDPMVKNVRTELSERYNVTDPYSMNYRYTGLCDASVAMLQDRIERYCRVNKVQLTFKAIHGEQAHTPKLMSERWVYQHTWCSVTSGRVTLYVDPTISQFKKFYDDVPDYYISPTPPKWFYPDSKNFSFSKVGSRINEFKITYKVRHRYSTEIVREGIIHYFQYEVWGSVSDLIHKMIKRRR